MIKGGRYIEERYWLRVRRTGVFDKTRNAYRVHPKVSKEIIPTRNPRAEILFKGNAACLENISTSGR